MRKRLLAAGIWLVAGTAAADDKAMTLAVDPALEQSGLTGHILPRFSLKTGVRVALVADGAEAVLGADGGTPIFQGGGTVYGLALAVADADTRRFADWLTSEVGRRTVEGFAPEGGPGYTYALARAADTGPAAPEGDAVAGADLALALCGRCHVVGEVNRMKGVGSTPSFALLRTFPDWLGRFQAFYALKPHPAFTQIPGVTEPFDDGSPPPMVPVEMEMDDLDAIIAFVDGIAPADLGAPLQSN
ncbi:hypothetical protein DXV76_06440 [Rhodobacteraceae bacterium CCMM004]|nr:hypothetical protein DXV76_06440 [Rhodobacteraceae bacterium CCMM004]